MRTTNPIVSGGIISDGQISGLLGYSLIESDDKVELAPAADKGVQINTTGSKPGASSSYRGHLFFEAGGGGVRDKLYICLKSDAGVYSWVQIVDGGA